MLVSPKTCPHAPAIAAGDSTLDASREGDSGTRYTQVPPADSTSLRNVHAPAGVKVGPCHSPGEFAPTRDRQASPRATSRERIGSACVASGGATGLIVRMGLSALNFLSYQNRARNRAAPLLFALFVGAQLALLLATVRYFFRPTWNQHISSGPWAILLTCLSCNLVLCFGEYFFHRYLLHIETVRFLRALCASHLAHLGSGARCTDSIRPITPTTSAT
jgi:hypothetical protein